MRTFGVVSLGCDKNRVDSENMISYLIEGGYTLTADANKAEVIIVNTCGFIKSAIEESISVIFDMSLNKDNKCKFLVVTGCMSQRFMDDIKDEFKEVDLFIGTSNYHNIVKYIDDLYNNKSIRSVKNDINDRNFTTKRYLTTPPHYAYLKIAEGCSNRCAYCSIPYIRGNYTSRDMDSLLDEVKDLSSTKLLKELIIVAQDVTRYGRDLYKEYKIVDLIKKIDSQNIDWIRLLYCYPELVNEELVDAIIESKHICHYLDIPLQHVSDKILKSMRRRITKDGILKLIKMIREKDKDFIIRSTFIVGFPGETEEDFNELYEFLKEYKLDRVGFFIYSREEGTAAYSYDNQLPESIKKARYRKLYNLQNKIMQEKQKEKINKEYDVIYEGIDFDKQLFVGRTKMDAPNIDSVIYFTAEYPLEVGNIYKVRINKVKGLDLYGEVL